MKGKHCLVVFVFFCKAEKTLAYEGRSMFFTLICTLNLLPNEQWPYGQETTQRWVLYEGAAVFFLWSNCFKYMHDVNQQGIRLSSNLSHECNQYRFHGVVSTKFECLLTCAHPCSRSHQLKAIWSVKKIHKVWVWLLHLVIWIVPSRTHQAEFSPLLQAAS